jgi:hypothetical protein
MSNQDRRIAANLSTGETGELVGESIRLLGHPATERSV